MLVLLLVGVTMQNAFFITFFSHLQAKLETKALKAKRPGFTDERYNETSYYYDINSSKYFSYIVRLLGTLLSKRCDF